jgi:hypothetical protein
MTISGRSVARRTAVVTDPAESASRAKRVPPRAAWNRPSLSATAPVKLPRT